MEEEVRGYEKWLKDYREERRCNEWSLQQEADEYVRNFLLSKKEIKKDSDDFQEVGEDGFVVIPEQYRRNEFTYSQLDPEIAEIIASKRKHKKNEGMVFEYQPVKRVENTKKAKKLRYNIKKNKIEKVKKSSKQDEE
ncbi:hypothetical protein EDI_096360 [Entamoeba dispar SAW760]|uniref:Ribosomal RNA-processing protein 7 C-terminal domain-containing protein n=1 Tax=Entamoeba dispar (strain ATCC PRA-260 / SAW760) TaxID=370354 RepID=B0EPS2_ENTDS|nr:uncharacterized protein EDI_096360 [Entamoeba dispar SAW760]EDR23502.1 hypothetical protein EDI_096360 [Entamoeba dispar SAW760]|eukprot:EDR23502.1 hypothetical protein EDI_096360 [Entamoeba dispar SAW760]